MAVINTDIGLTQNKKKTVNNGNTTVELPTTGNTDGLYGKFISEPNSKSTMFNGGGGVQLSPTTPSDTYGAVLTPNLTSNLTTPVYTPVIDGGSVGGAAVKMPDVTQHFDGSVVGTVGGGFSGSNKGGVTDEGIIVGGSKNADDATFDNNGFKGTGATFVPSASGSSGGSGSVSNGGNTTGTGAGANTGTGDSTPTDTKTDTEKTPTMTYEQYIAEQKVREEEKRQAALKEAEIYKERAAADAQASYMQNMSTYGVNAENMAQMGLTGGGYSDYLNAQAYAQKRGEIQTASANEMTLKQQAETTYADGIAALNKDLFTYQETQRQNKTTGYNTLLGYAMDSESGLTEELIRAMGKNIGLSEEEIQSVINTMNTTQSNAKGEYSNNAFTALIADLQNPNAYGNYSEAGIRALGKQWGWTDEQIQQAVDIWNDTKKSTEVSLDGESEDDGASAFESTVSDIQSAIVQDGQVLFKNTGGSYTAYTREQVYEMCLQDRNAGNLTDDEVKQIMTEYDRKLAYAKGEISADTYYDSANGNANAQTVADAQTIAKGVMKVSSPTSKVVNVMDSNFKTTDFGDYTDMGKSGTTQEKYAQAIVADAKAGKIQVGQYVIMNYGNTWEMDCVFVYIGNGVFVKCKDGNGGNAYGASEEFRSGVSFYEPDGYDVSVNWNGNVHVSKD